MSLDTILLSLSEIIMLFIVSFDTQHTCITVNVLWTFCLLAKGLNIEYKNVCKKTHVIWLLRKFTLSCWILFHSPQVLWILTGRFFRMGKQTISSHPSVSELSSCVHTDARRHRGVPKQPRTHFLWNSFHWWTFYRSLKQANRGDKNAHQRPACVLAVHGWSAKYCQATTKI